MARIVVGSYMVRYPLGGMMSYVLQYLVGFQRLGHDVYFVEKAGYPNSCYDPARDVMSDDCTCGATAVNALLRRFDLDGRWCYVDAEARYHGLSKPRIEEVLRTCDMFLDMGTHGAWLDDPIHGVRVLLDGEPGFTQMKMANRQSEDGQLHEYDFYYTAGCNIGTPQSSAPSAGQTWRHLWHPIVVDMFEVTRVDPDAPYTTVMNWQSHGPIEFEGRAYHQKDVEFAQFLQLPQMTSATLELAVSGRHVPRQQLIESGWRVRDAHAVTSSFDSFVDYIAHSRGEFSVCKNVFVATNSGWFSDRSAVYLASGRPVAMQDTGFSTHLPCGEGLFAFRTAEAAVAALEEIDCNYERHSRRAREVAAEYLDASKVLGGMLAGLGLE